MNKLNLNLKYSVNMNEPLVTLCLAVMYFFININSEMKHFLLRPHTKHEAQLLSETRTGTEEQLQKFKLAEEELAQVKVLSWVVILSMIWVKVSATFEEDNSSFIKS